MISNAQIFELYQPICRWNCFFHLKGRITDCHDGSGMKDSWSWNSSNFYHDDIMDITYTDPSFVPVYSLDGISQSLLQVKKLMWINQSHDLDLLCDWSFSNNTIWAMIGLCCCIAFIWTVLLVSLCLMHVWLDRTLQFLIFHLYDHRPNWIPCGSFAIIEKGETRLQQKKKKKDKPTFLTNPMAYHRCYKEGT